MLLSDMTPNCEHTWRGSCKKLLEVVQVSVAEHMHMGPRTLCLPRAVDDAGMIEGVAEDVRLR